MTSRYHGSKISGSHNREGAQATTPAKGERTVKKQQVYIVKTTTLHVRHSFLYVS